MATWNQNIPVSTTQSSYLLYYLHKTLVSAGWIVKQCYDSVHPAYADDTDHVNTLAIWQAANTWSLLQEPAPRSTRYMILGRLGGSATTCYLGYARVGPYVASAGNAIPLNSTTANETPLLGTYTWNTGAKAVGNCCEASAQYLQAYASGSAFYLVMYRVGTAFMLTSIYLDPLAQYDVLDPDPCVVRGLYATGGDVYGHGDYWPCWTGGGVKAHLGGVNDLVYNSISACALYSVSNTWSPSTAVIPAGASSTSWSGSGTSPWGSKDATVPAIYVRPNTLGAPYGWKGISDGLLKIRGGAPRANGSLLSIAATGDRITFGYFVHPWNNQPVSL